MLPDALSTDRTSLVEGGERLVVVAELHIAPDGTVRGHEVYRALAVNRAKLELRVAGVARRAGRPDKVSQGRSLETICGPGSAAGLLRRHRQRERRARPRHGGGDPGGADGVVESLQVNRKNRARDLIEDFMIAANGATARFLAAAGRAAIRRVVREPRRWDRIADIAASYGTRLPPAPDGKALADSWRRGAPPIRCACATYSLSRGQAARAGEYISIGRAGRRRRPLRPVGAGLHARTAPNRRYADLVPRSAGQGASAGARRPNRRRVDAIRPALHRARERRQQGRTGDPQVPPPRCCSSAVPRRHLRRHRHRVEA